MKKIVFVALYVVLVTLLFCGPYTTPTIDGNLSDWDSNELRVNDSNTDSAWGTNNEFDNLWVTWDADNLYVGIEYTALNNAMIVYFDMDITGGETDFNSNNGYGGAYPRNITFNSADDIDLMVASWNGGYPGVWTVVDNNSTDISGNCNIAGTTTAEIAIPWVQIYGDLTPCTIPTGAIIKAVGIIAGGDNWGACDSAPDNSDTDGDGGPDHLTNLWSANLDSDNDCTPDDEAPTAVVLSSFTAAYLDGKPYLNWVTQSESDNQGWNIYRNETDEIDGALQINLHLIAGAGTTSEPTEYQFSDYYPVDSHHEYYYWIEEVNVSGLTSHYGPISLMIPAHDGNNPAPPLNENAAGYIYNFPNPAHTNSTIHFMVRELGFAEVSIYNIKGQKIKTVFKGNITGENMNKVQSVYWNGTDDDNEEVSDGIYLNVLKINGKVFTHNMIIMK